MRPMNLIKVDLGGGLSVTFITELTALVKLHKKMKAA